jgi:hypothetical protein
LTEGGFAELRDLQAARRERLGTAIQHMTEAEQLGLLASIRSLRTAFERISQEGDPIS